MSRGLGFGYKRQCKNGTKSYHATKYLMRLGYNVVNVIGGIDHWIGSVVTNYA